MVLRIAALERMHVMGLRIAAPARTHVMDLMIAALERTHSYSWMGYSDRTSALVTVEVMIPEAEMSFLAENVTYLLCSLQVM